MATDQETSGQRHTGTDEKAEARAGSGFSERYGGGVPGKGDGQLGTNDRAERRGDYGTPPPGQRDRPHTQAAQEKPKKPDDDADDNGARTDGVPPPVS